MPEVAVPTFIVTPEGWRVCTTEENTDEFRASVGTLNRYARPLVDLFNSIRFFVGEVEKLRVDGDEVVLLTPITVHIDPEPEGDKLDIVMDVGIKRNGEWVAMPGSGAEKAAQAAALEAAKAAELPEPASLEDQDPSSEFPRE